MDVGYKCRNSINEDYKTVTFTSGRIHVNENIKLVVAKKGMSAEGACLRERLRIKF